MGLMDMITDGLPKEHATGTGNGGLPAALMGLLANRQSGGLGGLLGRFNDAGLGHVANSWVGSGPNQPVSPQDLHRALGDEQVQSMASQTGMSTAQLLPLLAQFLPGIVDRLTPHGRVPDGDILHQTSGGGLGRP